LVIDSKSSPTLHGSEQEREREGEKAGWKGKGGVGHAQRLCGVAEDELRAKPWLGWDLTRGW
jgi:hypothetical protein